jgi:hypothetical protein
MRKRYKKNRFKKAWIKTVTHTLHTHTNNIRRRQLDTSRGLKSNLSVFSQMAANTFNKFQIVIYRSEDIRGPVISEIIPPLEVSLLSVKVSLNVDSSSDVATLRNTGISLQTSKSFQYGRGTLFATDKPYCVQDVRN